MPTMVQVSGSGTTTLPRIRFVSVGYKPAEAPAWWEFEYLRILRPVKLFTCILPPAALAGLILERES